MLIHTGGMVYSLALGAPAVRVADAAERTMESRSFVLVTIEGDTHR